MIRCSPHGRTMGDEGGDAGGGGGEGHGEGEGAAAVATGEIVTVVTVAMAVGISFTLHLLEVGIRRFKYSTLMLKMIFRETMIVGVVSAVLYGMERTDTSIEHDQVALSCTALCTPHCSPALHARTLTGSCRCLCARRSCLRRFT